MENIRKATQLIKRLSDENQEIRVSAADALVKIGEPAVPMLIEVLKGQNQETRYEAVYVLGEIGRPAMPALIEALADEEWEVRYSANEALSRIGEPAVPALKKALANADDGVRSWAAWGLGVIGEPAKTAVPMLIQALSDEHWDVRMQAAHALEEIGISEAMQAVEEFENSIRVETIDLPAHEGTKRIRQSASK